MPVSPLRYALRRRRWPCATLARSSEISVAITPVTPNCRVRGGDGLERFGRRRIVEKVHAAAAIDLDVDEAGREQAVEPGCAWMRGALDLDDAAVIDEHGGPSRISSPVNRREETAPASACLRDLGERRRRIGRAAAPQRRRVRHQIETQQHRHQFDHGGAVLQRLVAFARPSGEMNSTWCAALFKIGGDLLQAVEGLVALGEDDGAEVWPGEGEGTVANFGGADRLGVEAVGFFELERGFRRDGEAGAAADDVNGTVAIEEGSRSRPLPLQRVGEAIRRCSLERGDHVGIVLPVRGEAEGQRSSRPGQDLVAATLFRGRLPARGRHRPPRRAGTPCR